MKCPYCGQDFDEAAFLVGHVRTKKCDRRFEPASADMFTCAFCGELVNSPRSCSLRDYQDHIESCAAYQAAMLTGTPVVFRGAV